MFDDVCSGRATERAGLDKALDIMRDGDTLVVWKLDRIGRSLPHVVGLVGDLQKRGIGLMVLTGDIEQLAITLSMARRYQRISRQNILTAIGYNMIAVPTALFGGLSPVTAAVAMSASSILALANAARCEKFRRDNNSYVKFGRFLSVQNASSACLGTALGCSCLPPIRPRAQPART